MYLIKLKTTNPQVFVELGYIQMFEDSDLYYYKSFETEEEARAEFMDLVDNFSDYLISIAFENPFDIEPI